jgi:hypothetical protein
VPILQEQQDYTTFHSRDTLDLRITPGGIKRWVIHYRAPFHKCRDCERTVVPQTLRNQRRFGHSLIAWAIHQHVTNRITFENRELATLFGRLIRSIISTVDRVGLRTSYLSKHKPEVKEFIDVLTLKAFESEIAGKYCKRILKYQSKLFTFLDHDGVPWNNNNAEHAVKYFAKYRRHTNGRVTESGLKDYLVLLSIYQTCRYREIRFLDFLFSKARDIDRFIETT